MPPPEPRVANLTDPETLPPPPPDSDTMAPGAERGREDGGDKVVEGKDDGNINVGGGVPGGGDSFDSSAKRPRMDNGTGTDDVGDADKGTGGGPAPASLAADESDGEDGGGRARDVAADAEEPTEGAEGADPCDGDKGEEDDEGEGASSERDEEESVTVAASVEEALRILLSQRREGNNTSSSPLDDIVALHEKTLRQIPVEQSGEMRSDAGEGSIANEEVARVGDDDDALWVPPLDERARVELATDATKGTNSVGRGGNRGTFHRCLREAFPLLSSQTVQRGPAGPGNGIAAVAAGTAPNGDAASEPAGAKSGPPWNDPSAEEEEEAER